MANQPQFQILESSVPLLPCLVPNNFRPLGSPYGRSGIVSPILLLPSLSPPFPIPLQGPFSQATPYPEGVGAPSSRGGGFPRSICSPPRATESSQCSAPSRDTAQAQTQTHSCYLGEAACSTPFPRYLLCTRSCSRSAGMGQREFWWHQRGLNNIDTPHSWSCQRLP